MSFSFLTMLKNAVLLTVFVSLLNCYSYAITSPAGSVLADQQTEDWNEIIKLYNEGYKIIDKQGKNWDDEELWSERKKIFTNAADKLALYIKTYISDPNSLTYLRTKYRLGTFLEIAQQFEAAGQAYLFCRTHPLIRSAQFDEKPLHGQVEERIRQIQSNQRKQYTRRPGYIYIHKGGGNAIFEERDHEFLPLPVDDLRP